MISYLSGIVRFTEKVGDAEAACIDVGGVGYRVLMPVPDVARLADIAGGEAKTTAYVHTHVREDAIVLFGFSSRDGLALFEKLISVQGVGPKTALAMLSGIDGADLVRAIGEKDEARLTRIPGVGKKTAARIVLELGDRMAKESLSFARGPSGNDGPAHSMDDLRSALANLGYKAPQIDRAVQKLKPLVHDGAVLSDLVREALKHVG